MRDFQNAFDAALAGVDSTIVEVMGISAQFTSGAQRGGEVHGVFDDPESLGFASSGIRIEGSNPSLFVLTDTVCAVRRGDTLTINGEMFWVDRVSPDDGGVVISGSTGGNHLPPAVAAERGCMAIKVLSRPLKTSAVSAKRQCLVPPQWPLTALLHPRYRSRRHWLPVRQRYAGNW